MTWQLQTIQKATTFGLHVAQSLLWASAGANPSMTQNSKSFYKAMNGNLWKKMHIPLPLVTQFHGGFPEEILLSCGPTRLWRILVAKGDDGRLFFGMGWSDFVQDNEVLLGDLLVFRYAGSQRFEVDIFGTSGCSRKIDVDRAKSSHCVIDIDSDTDSESAMKKPRTSKAAAEHVEKGNLASKVKFERSASSPNQHKSACAEVPRGGIKGSDTVNVAVDNKASLKKRASVDESSGSRKPKVSFEVERKLKKEEHLGNEQFVEKVQEAKLTMKTDGYMKHGGDGAGKASSKQSVKVKSSCPEEPKPTNDELYAAVVDILMEEEDLCSARDSLSFMLRKLAKYFGVDLRHRKAEVKAILDTFIFCSSDDDEKKSKAAKRKASCEDARKPKKAPKLDYQELQPRSSHCVITID